MPAEWISPVGETPLEPSADPEVNPMAEMLERYISCPKLKRGQIVSGTVIRIISGDILVDIGAKCEGLVQEHDLKELSQADRDAVQVGSEVMVCIVNPEDDNGNIILSISQAQIVRDWKEAQRLLESQEATERRVSGYNKGGVIVDVGEIRGFVPGSLLTISRAAPQATAEPSREERWATLVGKTIQLKVIEVDQERNRLILSERAALRDSRKKQRESLLKDLTEGETHRGHVINLADFGAFVDLGGIDGLVHLSELSWKRIAHPREVVKIGQEVDVCVLNVDKERQRVALSIKRLLPDPWNSVAERYQEGQLVEGVITNLTKWGAFASIVGDEAIEGLIHISELDDRPIVHPRDVIQPEQVVTLRVIGLDATHHRLSLSLKRVSEGEFMEQDWQAALAAEQPESESPLSVALSEAIDSSENSTLASTKGQ